MTTLTPRFVSRAFGFQPDPRVKWRVNSMQWNAQWGCDTASISAFGEPSHLAELVEYLRRGVVIRDEIGRAAWWGLVYDARVRLGAMEGGATLASMTNAAAVAYSYVAPGTQTVGQRKTTSWAVDQDSIDEYGRKEFLSSQGGLSDAAAEARRDAILDAYAWPGGSLDPFGAPRGKMGYSGAKASQSATLMCRGWSATLGWRYATVASVVGPGYSTVSTTEQAVGSASTDTKVFEKIGVGSQTCNVLQVRLYCRKQGGPTDNFKVDLYLADSNGVPTGSALGSGTVAGSGMSTSLGWVTVPLTSETQLKAATWYCLQVSRSGAADGTNYYVVNVNTALGYAGVFRIWNGSAWVARSPDADMPFRLLVNNNVESTEQIRDIVTDLGAFITGVDIEDESGLLLPSYRDGDTLVSDEVLALMESGGANGRRLLSEVDLERRMRVWEEPASSAVRYYLRGDGVLLDRNQRMWPQHLSPVGNWCQVKDFLSANADLTRLNNLELQFIEGATWSSMAGMRVRFRGQPSIEDLGKVGK